MFEKDVRRRINKRFWDLIGKIAFYGLCVPTIGIVSFLIALVEICSWGIAGLIFAFLIIYGYMTLTPYITPWILMLITTAFAGLIIGVYAYATKREYDLYKRKHHAD